jgi:hypothetical protein
LLPADEVHVAVGDSGLGKTPFAYQLGLCVAAGIPFLGHATQQGRVLYLDFENGPEAVLSLATSLCHYLKLERFPEQFLVRRDEDLPELEIAVPQFKPSLVIVDTLRAFCPSAETKNEEAGKLLKFLRALARCEHCTILLLHHVRKPKLEEAVTSLENTPTLEWLYSASGARALINQTNARIAFDSHRAPMKREAALVVKCFVKLKGEIGPIYIERVCTDDGEPTGYRRMVGPDLLGNPEQEAAYARLPEEFTFREAVQAYARTDDPTRKFLKKCISVGILEQLAHGTYHKPSVEKVEQVENQLEVPSVL